LFSKVGEVYNRRLTVKLDPAISARVKQKIASDVHEFHGRRVVQQNRVDGLKLLFDDGSWVLMRASGTEPVVRCYVESTSQADLDKLLEYGKQWIIETRCKTSVSELQWLCLACLPSPYFCWLSSMTKELFMFIPRRRS